MGVVKNQKKQAKTKNDATKTEVANGKPKKDDSKVKKKKKVSCLQCIKSHDDGGLEGKYRVAAPELMQDTFMSDSEDEGGEVECPIQQQQQYRYMNSEAGTLHRAKPLEDSVTDGHLWPSNNDKKVATIERQPVDIGFLVSFVVDARGGAMKAKRRGGVRIIVPPAACAAPTRVTCRAATRRAPAAAPPPLMEGEALASRLLELQPQGAKFLAPVIIEVPIFTASCREREIVILRSDTGETWQDHYLHNNDNPLIQEALARERQEHGPSCETLGESGERVTRVVTCDFPHYLAVVSRVRQEVHVIGPEGGTVSSAHIPQVQALFPPQALTKRIRVGLQAHGAAPELARRVLPRHAAVSPVLTVEPRRRKFHRSITLTVPLPAQQGAVHDKQSTATLRLLCSIMGGQARAVWEDVTGSTPLTLTEDCASFTTTVSARFWLMNCQNVSDATKLATELYREMLLVPFEVRIVVLGKRLDALEGRLLVLYITDRYAYETLLQQEHYTEIAHSTAVRFLDGKEVYLEFSGNLVPVTKSGSQPMFTFEAFKDNRVEFTVRVKHHEESPSGRVYFMNEPKVAKGEQSQTPACVLDVELPERIAPRAAKSQMDYLNLDQSGFDALKDELSFHWGDHNNSLGPPSLPQQDHQVNGHDKVITNGDVKYPTKETEDKSPKPQVNGGTVHVDSNKTKATFDSDEDKTPMNTLEKGKKKPEGGSFFGGIADKVKNVFGHSDETNEEIRESSPKPQPKPRESKDKTPPKPAPRLITEDLLEKVDDMFKDVKHRPHNKDEDELDSQLYSTKLIVDEESDRPKCLDNITEEVYQQYENMQPVETPLHCKTSDPFQFYTGCCEGKYKKGQKHRHDETSNLVDRVEHINFTVHEKLDKITDDVQNNFKDGMDKLENEKDGLKKKSNDITEDLIEKADVLKKDFENKGGDFKSGLEEKSNDSENALNDQLNKLSETANTLNDNAIQKKDKLQSNIEAEIENAKSSAQDTLSELAETTTLAKSKLDNKAHELDFAARERAEELRLRGLDEVNNLEGHFNNAKDNVNQKTNKVVQSVNNMTENLNNTAQDIKNNLDTEVDQINETTNQKIDDINESINNAKDKSKKAAADLKTKAEEKKDQIETEVKKKKKEGKNFFTGLVHNIFGEKDKIENEIKEKVSETEEFTDQLVKQASDKKEETNDKLKKGRQSVEKIAQEQTDKAKEKVSQVKESADDLVHKASSKKVVIMETINNKKQKLEDEVDRLVQKTEEEEAETKQLIKNKKDEALKAVSDQTEEIKKTVNGKKEAVVKVVEDNLDNLRHTKDEVQSEAQSELEKIWQEAIQTTEEIKKSGGVLVDGACNKTANIQSTVSDQYYELKHNTTDKLDDLKESSKQTIEDIQNSAINAFGNMESAAKDKSNSAKEAWEDLQSSTRDTYADMKDDVTSLENSAQDTLHSFQSSAGNTFDSLDDSVKEYVSGAQNTVQNVESNSKELFGEMKNNFEGFQISADNKLEDVKTTAAEGLENAGATLEETKAAVKNDLKGAEESVINTVTSGADKLASGIDALGGYALGAFDQGVKKDSSTKLLESEKAQSSPHKKSSGIPKLKRKK